MVPFEKAKVSSYRPPIITVSLSFRVSEILPLLCPITPFFPTHLYSPPNFPHVPLVVGGWPWATKSEGVRQIVSAVTFLDFQPMWS